jgi:hypothetical protein
MTFAGAVDVDGVAVLAGAAGARGDVLDAIVDHQGAVVAGLRPPHQDAVVAGPSHRVAGELQAARIEREDAGTLGACDGGAGHLALAGLQHDAVAAGGHDLAFGDAHAAGVREVHEAAALGEGQAGTVEREAGERQGVGAVSRHQRRPAREHEPGGAAHAGQLRPGRQI